MARRPRVILLAALVLAGFGATATSQTQKQYEAFVRAEINRCVDDALRIDKESGSRTRPDKTEHYEACREMMMQVHDLYPMPEEKRPEEKKKSRPGGNTR